MSKPKPLGPVAREYLLDYSVAPSNAFCFVCGETIGSHSASNPNSCSVPKARLERLTKGMTERLLEAYDAK